MPLSHRDYTVACICPMGVELAPVKAMLDQAHPSLPTQRDQNSYTLGEMGGHNIVIAVLPEIGTNSAATVAIQLLNDFPSIRFGLLVGIGGGVPDEEEDSNDIRLGDVVVSKPTASFGGVVQYDLGKYETGSGFKRTGVLTKPPLLLRASVETLAANHQIKGSRVPQYLSDMLQQFPAMEEEYSYPGAQQDQLFQADYPHPGGPNCHNCDKQRIVERDNRRNKNPKFHYGAIGSANTVVKDAGLRGELRRALKIICVEMEAAGLMDSFPCLVIRGICDYADSHKNKKWQPYAAATAAAYMKELLSVIPPKDVAKVSPATSNVAAILVKQNFNIPFSLNGVPVVNKFVGRNLELRHLQSLLPSTEGKRRKVIVLHGLAGIGKTQLALEFARRHKDAFTAVVWLNGKTKETLVRSLASYANKLPGVEDRVPTEDDQTDIEEVRKKMKEVLSWFSLQGNTDWLIVFDNIDKDDPSGIGDEETYDIKSYFPDADHGSIVITTRLNRLNELGLSLRLEKLSHEEALELLRQSVGQNFAEGADPTNSAVDAKNLVIKLDGLPLAVVSAGSFMGQTGTNASKYLEMYTSSWRDLQRITTARRDYENGTIETTWIISYEQIEKEDEFATKLLRLFACFDNQDVWFGLLKHGSNDSGAPEWFCEIISSEMSFIRHIRTLMDYSFIKANESTGSYSMHSVLQDWCNGYLGGDQNDDFARLALTAIGYAVPEPLERQYWVLQQRLLPHANRMMTYLQNERRFRNDQEKSSFNTSLLKLGSLYQCQGEPEEAEAMLQRAQVGLEKSLGAGHALSVRAVSMLTVLYWQKGKLAEAEDMSQRELEVAEKALGADHEATLELANVLGMVYKEQGKIAEAEAKLQRVQAGYAKTLGPDHVQTLNTVNNLSWLYHEQGKLAEAEALYQQSLPGLEKMLGPDHPLTLSAMSTTSLGHLFSYQGKLTEAAAIHQRAMALCENAFGPDHILTLNMANSLGLVYLHQGREAEAETAFRRALAGFEKALGAGNRLTLVVVCNLGLLYMSQGRSAAAEESYQRVLPECERELGANHMLTLTIMRNLGSLYRIQGRWTDAEATLKRALGGFEETFGPHHPHTLTAEDELGILYKEQGKLMEAEWVFERVLLCSKKLFGPDYHLTLCAEGELGYIRYLQGDLWEAEDILQQVLAGCEKALVSNHPVTLNTFHALGNVYRDQRKWAIAESMYQRGLAGHKEVHGLHHHLTLTMANSLSLVYFLQEKWTDAETMLQQALAWCEKGTSPNGPPMLKTISLLGDAYKKQRKFAMAESTYQRGLAQYENIEDKLALTVAFDLSKVYYLQEKLVEADTKLQQVLAVFEKSLSNDRLKLKAIRLLGNVYKDQGKWAMAESMYQRGLAEHEGMYGPDSKMAIKMAYDLGRVYYEQKKLMEAKAILQRALVGCEKVLGPYSLMMLEVVFLLETVDPDFDTSSSEDEDDDDDDDDGMDEDSGGQYDLVGTVRTVFNDRASARRCRSL